MLTLDGVHTYYGSSHVLQGVSLALAAGEIVGLLGRNGVGKTTTLRTIMGLAPVRRGQIELRGASIAGLPPYAVARRGIAYVPEERRVFPNLTVQENLDLAVRDRTRPAWNHSQVYDLFPRLAERRRQLGGTLSGGEQQMLAISRALLTNPMVLLLDEPSQGLAPQVVRAVEVAVRSIRDSGVTVLLVEQNVRLALDLADRHYILAKGRVVHAATGAELRDDVEVAHRFLGV